MDPLVIKFEGGAYSLVVPNSGGAEIGFKSAIDDPAYGVRQFAAEMANGPEAVISNSEFIFDDGGQLTVDELTGFFESTDGIELGIATVYECVEGSALVDELAAAGEALALAL